ncbi:membrane lipoprotein lipid attachment site-containing protein [Ruminococcaceae bacterium OttesenSCG-928-I18]|nr:membrane lipoprotein lipid attachment site-containing protein [Ruminococcaceae bacterium OttesenSCG-928-I18]
MKKMVCAIVMIALLTACSESSTQTTSVISVDIPIPGTSNSFFGEKQIVSISDDSMSELSNPSSTDIVINDELVNLVGATNGELKALLGISAISSLISGYTPSVWYGEQPVIYPLGFSLNGSDEAMDTFMNYEGPRDPTPLENVFPDENIVTGTEVTVARRYSTGEGPNDYYDYPDTIRLLFKYEGNLTEERLNDFFGQIPEKEYPSADYVEMIGEENGAFYAMEYTYNNRFFGVIYEKDSGIASDIEISLESNKGNYFRIIM